MENAFIFIFFLWQWRSDSMSNQAAYACTSEKIYKIEKNGHVGDCWVNLFGHGGQELVGDELKLPRSLLSHLTADPPGRQSNSLLQWLGLNPDFVLYIYPKIPPTSPFYLILYSRDKIDRKIYYLLFFLYLFYMKYVNSKLRYMDPQINFFLYYLFFRIKIFD